MSSEVTVAPPPQNIVYWQSKQEQLTGLLEEWGATQGAREIDWERGYLLWRDSAGEGVIRASSKALCSYNRPERSLLMAWAGDAAEDHATIPATTGVPSLLEPCSEGDAWLWAMHLADLHRASYLYRYATAEYLVFLGLWEVVVLVEEEIDPSPPQSPLPEAPSDTPEAFIIELLDDLRTLLRTEPDPSAIRRGFLSHAQAFHVNAQLLVEDGADPALLSETESLIRTQAETFGQRRFGLLPPPPLDDRQREKLHRQLLERRTDWLRGVLDPAGQPPY